MKYLKYLLLAVVANILAIGVIIGGLYLWFGKLDNMGILIG